MHHNFLKMYNMKISAAQDLVDFANTIMVYALLETVKLRGFLLVGLFLSFVLCEMQILLFKGKL